MHPSIMNPEIQCKTSNLEKKCFFLIVTNPGKGLRTKKIKFEHSERKIKRTRRKFTKNYGQILQPYRSYCKSVNNGIYIYI